MLFQNRYKYTIIDFCRGEHEMLLDNTLHTDRLRKIVSMEKDVYIHTKYLWLIRNEDSTETTYCDTWGPLGCRTTQFEYRDRRKQPFEPPNDQAIGFYISYMTYKISQIKYKK